jgi:hypothetical protein
MRDGWKNLTALMRMGNPLIDWKAQEILMLLL